MSTISQSRKALEDVLVAGGLRIVPQGVAAPPSLFVAPGNSWITPSQLAFGRANVNWVIIGVVSSANDVSIQEIDDLAQLLMIACKALPTGWGQPTIASPGILTLGGVSYLAFRAEIEGVI